MTSVLILTMVIKAVIDQNRVTKNTSDINLSKSPNTALLLKGILISIPFSRHRMSHHWSDAPGVGCCHGSLYNRIKYSVKQLSRELALQ